MKILTILGTVHNGNTKAITNLFLEQFNDESNTFEEIILPKDMENFCYGCANCILKGEEKCPHYNVMKDIVKKIEEADFLIVASPVFVMSCSSGLKALFDHLGYMWIVHRPNEKMFGKVALVITTAGGSGVKSTIKLIKKNLFYLGISKIHSYKITTLKMNGNYDEYSKKDKIKNEVIKKSKNINKSLKKKTVSLRTKFIFNLFLLTQKNGWNKTDSNYWKQKGWIDGKRPY